MLFVKSLNLSVRRSRADTFVYYLTWHPNVLLAHDGNPTAIHSNLLLST